MTVKRYDPELGHDSPPVFPDGMEPHESGDYVKYSDYAKLQQAIKRIVEAEADLQREVTSNHISPKGLAFYGQKVKDVIADAAKMVEDL